jgi:hypothetical protein
MSTLINSSKRKATSGAGARKKGLHFERNIANELGHVFPEAKRHLESQSDEAAQGVDLSNTGVFKIQCKFKQNYENPSTVLKIQTSNENEIPVLVTKANGREAMAVLPFEKFVTLVEIAYGHSPRLRDFNEKEVIAAPEVLPALPLFEADLEEMEEVPSPFKPDEPSLDSFI